MTPPDRQTTRKRRGKAGGRAALCFSDLARVVMRALAGKKNKTQWAEASVRTRRRSGPRRPLLQKQHASRPRVARPLSPISRRGSACAARFPSGRQGQSSSGHRDLGRLREPGGQSSCPPHCSRFGTEVSLNSEKQNKCTLQRLKSPSKTNKQTNKQTPSISTEGLVWLGATPRGKPDRPSMEASTRMRSGRSASSHLAGTLFNDKAMPPVSLACRRGG